ncbi:Fc.00g044080.m01.CDS01 [Cosmosporella sp. VM-42]
MSSNPNTDGEVGMILSTKTWFGFDLDDTLHEFCNASRAATTHCLTLIADKHPQVSLEDLQECYRQVLSHSTGNAFIDGKSSQVYRRARFMATLNQFSLGWELIEQLLEEYEQVLVKNLKLKDGAVSLLQATKASGRKVIVITEGPQDAQERAVRDLGIADYIDFLATTNYFGVSKTSGLFPKVLDHLDIQSGEIAYVGDSTERDIVPARAVGIYAIHFDEQQSSQIIDNPPSVNSLTILRDLLSSTSSH